MKNTLKDLKNDKRRQRKLEDLVDNMTDLYFLLHFFFTAKAHWRKMQNLDGSEVV